MSMESKKAEEIKKKAEADASKILREAEQKGRLIIEQAKKKADALAAEVIKEVEQKGRLIIEEARKKAESQIKSAQPAPNRKARQILEEAREKAEAEASKIIAEAEQKGRLIIEEAQKVAAKAGASKPATDLDPRASKIIAEAEQKARQIIEEAERMAAAPATQRPPHNIKAVGKKAALKTKEKEQQSKASHRKHVEIIIAAPVDFSQLEKFRTSLHHLHGLRILSTGGSPGGGTQISIMMDKPTPLAENLNAMEVVEEAVEEELLDSHPLRDFLRNAMPSPATKRPPDTQRVLVVLKRVQ
jgi:vacuolar-type H+-ATPase subunit H